MVGFCVAGVGGAEGPGYQCGLEEEPGEALLVGVETKGVPVVDVLADVAGEDGGEEGDGEFADGGAISGWGGDESGSKGDFNKA